MRPSRPPPFLTLWSLLALLSAPPHILAHPTGLIAVQHDERGLSDVLSGATGVLSGASGVLGGASTLLGGTSTPLGSLTADIGNLIADATTLLTDFVAVIQAFDNATHENDLVNLLGVDVKGNARKDKAAVTNATVGPVAANVTCPGMAVLFARGTAEPGNVGIFTGPSFFTALRNYVNGSTDVAIQGVPYPATVAGFATGGSHFGSAVMALMVSRTAEACPKTKLVLAGYSQGAQVVHNAMKILNTGIMFDKIKDEDAESTKSKHDDRDTEDADATAAANITTANANNTVIVPTGNTTVPIPTGNTSVPVTAPAAAPPNDARTITSVVLFGDPRNGTAVSGIDAARVLTICHPQDDICKGGDIITLGHLTYNSNAAQAAMFVMQRSALGVASSDAVNQGMSNVPVVKNMAVMDGSTQIGKGAGLPGFGFFGGRMGKGAESD